MSRKSQHNFSISYNIVLSGGGTSVRAWGFRAVVPEFESVVILPNQYNYITNPMYGTAVRTHLNLYPIVVTMNLQTDSSLRI